MKQTMDQITRTLELSGARIRLIALEEPHFNALTLLAGDKRIWEFIPADMSSVSRCLYHFNKALDERKAGKQFPFVIVHTETNKIIGSTRLMDIRPEHRGIEIGWTWLHPDYWATGINEECKLLLLTFCFEELDAIRVQLKTDEKNVRSRKAIQKIGGSFEGILRKDVIRENGTIRTTAYFSLLDDEWPEKKIKLKQLAYGRPENDI